MQGTQIAYFVHDLADAAVSRRVRQLREGGMSIALAGFNRTVQKVNYVHGVPARSLGRVQDGRLISRAVTTILAALKAPLWGRHFAGVHSITGRNLEMLFLAAIVRRIFAPQARLIYELLDIHSLLAGHGPKSRAMRAIEAFLLRRCDAVIVSSPAFETEYLRRHHARLPMVCLVENKMVADGAFKAPAETLPVGPPWRIGWFGVLRCRRSLHALARLARAFPGQVEIEIRGKIAAPLESEFLPLVEATPGLRYFGPYRYPEDIAEIYDRVHFAWLVDFYEEGLNSSWLLPNRLYESGSRNVVPIALAGVQTGQWLQKQKLGVLLDQPMEESLEFFFSQITPDEYTAARARMEEAEPRLCLWTEEDVNQLSSAIRGPHDARSHIPAPVIPKSSCYGADNLCAN